MAERRNPERINVTQNMFRMAGFSKNQKFLLGYDEEKGEFIIFKEPKTEEEVQEMRNYQIIHKGSFDEKARFAVPEVLRGRSKEYMPVWFKGHIYLKKKSILNNVD